MMRSVERGEQRMNAVKSFWLGAATLLLSLLMFCPAALADDGQTWVWLSSNDKYSKFYAPASVHAVQSAVYAGTGALVATAIDAMRGRRKRSTTTRSSMSFRIRVSLPILPHRCVLCRRAVRFSTSARRSMIVQERCSGQRERAGRRR